MKMLPLILSQAALWYEVLLFCAHCLIYWYLQHWHWNEVLRFMVLQLLLQYYIPRVWYHVFAVCIHVKLRIVLMLYVDDKVGACDLYKHCGCLLLNVKWQGSLSTSISKRHSALLGGKKWWFTPSGSGWVVHERHILVSLPQAPLHGCGLQLKYQRNLEFRYFN